MRDKSTVYKNNVLSAESALYNQTAHSMVRTRTRRISSLQNRQRSLKRYFKLSMIFHLRRRREVGWRLVKGSSINCLKVPFKSFSLSRSRVSSFKCTRRSMIKGLFPSFPLSHEDVEPLGNLDNIFFFRQK